MNLYELAQDKINSTDSWANGMNYKLFGNANNTVYIGRTQHGSLVMFITVNDDLRKNAQVANIQLAVGCPGNFQCSEYQYQIWSKKMQEVL